MTEQELIKKIKNKEEINWNYVSEFIDLSESFISKYKDNVNWKEISINQTLSESFIDKHQDRVDWGFISMYQDLSESFIERFRSKMNLQEKNFCWQNLSIFQNLSEVFRIKNNIKTEKIKYDFYINHNVFPFDFYRRNNHFYKYRIKNLIFHSIKEIRE